MKFTSGLVSSTTDQWPTPQWLFDLLDEEFHFDLDVCADESNHKCAKWYSVEEDGLSQPWNGVCWMNPPYGREIGRWVRKAKESARGGGRRCLSAARAHGHPVVGGRHGGQRIAPDLRTCQVRRCHDRRAVPVSNSDFRRTQGPRDKTA